jgi:hypothetical protein
MTTTPSVILLGSGTAAADVARQIRESGVSLYWAQGDEVPGTPWMPALEAAFASAHTVLVLVGEGQDQTDPRVGISLDHAIPTGKKVIPVLLGDAKSSDLRGFLRSRMPCHADSLHRCRL